MSAMPMPTVARVPSQRVSLRPVAPPDLPALLAINGDPQVTRFLPYATWESLDDGEAWLDRMQALAATGTGQQLVVVRNDDDAVLGTVLLFRFDAGSARIELGYVLGRAHWGRGLMREALGAICGHAFTALGIRRIEAEVNPDNRASWALLERLRFVREGTLRKRWVSNGVAYDIHFYGCLVDEWRPA
jgi:RimJ/RimL family protein N-acetyltransferase